jgi:hypothetical protein
LTARIKAIAGKSRLARGVVQQYRLRTGQPDWSRVAQSTEYVSLRESARASGTKVLVATSGGGYLGATRLESLLAVALTARGADVHVLLCDRVLPACQEATLHWYLDDRLFADRGPSAMHCHACFSPAYDMYRSLGLVVHRYSDHLTDDDKSLAERLSATVPWNEIRSFRHDDVAVGEHAFAGAIRFYARANLEPEPVTEAIVRRYFRAALLTTFAMKRLVASQRFDVSVFHHGIYVPQGLVGEVLRQNQVRVVNWHVAYRKHSFVFSHGHTYHHTLMDEPTSQWDGVAWNEGLENKTLDYLKSRWSGAGDWIHFNRAPQSELAAISREVGVNFDKPCIGMLTNVMWDAQLHYPVNAFRDMLEWTTKTIDYFSRRPDLQLLIRVHPAELSGKLPSLQPIVGEIRKVYPKLPGNVFIIPPESKASTYTAMYQCNAVIIYGTKTGVELTAMGIPVIVAGEAWIRNKGLTTDVRSEKEYYETLDKLPLASRLPEETVRRARMYAFHFFFRRMIPIGVSRTVPEAPGYEFDVPEVGAVAPGKDRGIDVICDGILKGAPFVYPAEVAP